MEKKGTYLDRSYRTAPLLRKKEPTKVTSNETKKNRQSFSQYFSTSQAPNHQINPLGNPNPSNTLSTSHGITPSSTTSLFASLCLWYKILLPMNP